MVTAGVVRRRQVELLNGEIVAEMPLEGPEPQLTMAIVQPIRDVYCRRHPSPTNSLGLIEYANTSLVKNLDAKHNVYAQAGISAATYCRPATQASSSESISMASSVASQASSSASAISG